ncbi:MAG TPA: hypothetical protein VKI18_12515 [Albitalea sp.]|nr:hypothetical protein [Albitalea sp.]
MDPPQPDEPLQLVFSGECIDGHDPQAVREAVVKALKLDEKRAARLFSGKRVVLRRHVDSAAAQRQIARFASMGALLRAEPSKSLPPLASHSPARWQALRWAGIAVLSVVVAVTLGLVLGPALSALWPEAPAPGALPSSAAANLPTAAVPSPIDASPATIPAQAASARPATDEEIPKEMTAEAVREYRLGYLPATNHKAFAISAGGAHAWIAGAPSQSDARERALASCIGATQPSGEGCRVVDADGNWEN